MAANVLYAIEMAKEVKKSTAKARNEANKEYTSLSNVLKQIKAKALWDKGFSEAFAAVGITDKSMLTPAMFRDLAPEVCKEDKKGQKQLAVWGTESVKDENGQPVCDADGKKIMQPVQRIVKSWTPNKVLDILAQSIAFREAAAQAEVCDVAA